MPRFLPLLAVAALAAAPSFAAAGAEAAAKATPAATSPAARPTVAAAASPAERPAITVHHSPGCGCCVKWVEHLREARYPVTVLDSLDLDAERRRVGVPVGKASCHTAEVGGYFVEGHVPVADIDRLLREKPKARGLTAPGMPMGSPGMEMPDGATPKYDVLLVLPDGTTRVWATHGR